MQFEWDETKRNLNLRRHGIDFADLSRFFDGDLIVLEDDRYEYGEMRFLAFGLLFGRLIAVAYTERGEEVIRLISARKASNYETEQYYQRIAN